MGMKRNRWMLVLVIAIFAGSCIVGVSGVAALEVCVQNYDYGEDHEVTVFIDGERKVPTIWVDCPEPNSDDPGVERENYAVSENIGHMVSIEWYDNDAAEYFCTSRHARVYEDTILICIPSDIWSFIPGKCEESSKSASTSKPTQKPTSKTMTTEVCVQNNDDDSSGIMTIRMDDELMDYHGNIPPGTTKCFGPYSVSDGHTPIFTLTWYDEDVGKDALSKTEYGRDGTIIMTIDRNVKEPEPTPKPTPKPTFKPTPKPILEDKLKTVTIYIKNEDNNPLEVELYINGGYEKVCHVLRRQLGYGGRFKLPDDSYNEYVARWVDPDTGVFYEERVRDKGENKVIITLPMHRKEEVKSTPKPTPESDYKASDILIPPIPEVTVEVGETETIYFEIEYRSDKILQWDYLAEIDDVSIATMDVHGKGYAYCPIFHPGEVYGEEIHIRGRKEGTTVIDVSMSSVWSTTVLAHSEIKVKVVPKGTIQSEEEEIYPTPCNDLGNQPLYVPEDAGLLEAFGTMIIGGWKALMDFFH